MHPSWHWLANGIEKHITGRGARAVVGIAALIIASMTLVARIRAINRPPERIELLGRANELEYVRYLGHRLQLYAIAYGRPIYRYEVRDGRYAVDYVSARLVPAESTEMAALRRLLYGRSNVMYGFDERQAVITWYNEARQHFTRDSFPWPAGVDFYVAARKASVAPRRR